MSTDNSLPSHPFPVRAYNAFIRLASCLEPVVLLLLRLWGYEYMIDGWGKLTHHDKVLDFFTSLGIPHLVLMLGLSAAWNVLVAYCCFWAFSAGPRH